MQSCHIINHLKVHLHSGHRVRLHPSPDPRSGCSEGLVLRLVHAYCIALVRYFLSWDVVDYTPGRQKIFHKMLLYYCTCFEVSCTHDNNITHVNDMSGCGLTANIIIVYIWQGLSTTMRASNVYRSSACSVINSLPSVQHIHRYSSAPPSMST